MSSARSLTGVALLAVAGLAAGCASAPRTELADAGVAVPERFVGATVAGPAEGDWLGDFGEPALVELVDVALARNQDLLAAATRIEAAAAQARIAGADLWPQLSAGLTTSEREQVIVGIPIPGTDGVLQSRSSSAGLSLDLRWEADLWGRIRAGRLAARADLAATTADVAGARLSLAGQVAKVWFAATEARLQVGLAEETVASYRANSEAVRERYRLGLVGPLDLRLALSSQHAAEALLEARLDQLQRLVRQLELLAGAYPAGELAPATDLPPVPAPAPAGLPAELVARRPDLVAAERRLLAADARIAQARAARYPSLSLTGSTGYASDALGDMLGGDFSVWSWAASLLQPVFQGGRLEAQVELSEAGARAAVHEFAGAVLGAFGEVESALSSDRLLSDRQAALERTAAQAQAARDLAWEQYRRGLVGFLSVLEAERRALDSQSQLLAVRRERLANRVDLHLALGGGFGTAPEPIPGVLR